MAPCSFIFAPHVHSLFRSPASPPLCCSPFWESLHQGVLQNGPCHTKVDASGVHLWGVEDALDRHEAYHWSRFLFRDLTGRKLPALFRFERVCGLRGDIKRKTTSTDILTRQSASEFALSGLAHYSLFPPAGPPQPCSCTPHITGRMRSAIQILGCRAHSPDELSVQGWFLWHILCLVAVTQSIPLFVWPKSRYTLEYALSNVVYHE